MEIKLIEIRSIAGNGPLKAFADIKIDNLTIHEFRIFKRDGQRVQVQAPLASWRDRDGIIRYRSLLSAPPELMQRIEVTILSGWEKGLRNGKSAG